MTLSELSEEAYLQERLSPTSVICGIESVVRQRRGSVRSPGPGHAWISGGGYTYYWCGRPHEHLEGAAVAIGNQLLPMVTMRQRAYIETENTPYFGYYFSNLCLIRLGRVDSFWKRSTPNSRWSWTRVQNGIS